MSNLEQKPNISKEKIENMFANLMGLKLKVAQDSTALEQGLYNMTESEILSFYGYCQKHKDSITFQTKHEKFMTLSMRFKKGVKELKAKDELALIPNRARDLAQKVKEVSTAYADVEYKRIYLGHRVKQLHFKSFKDYFTDYDIGLLQTIGSLGKCIKMQQATSGVDALEDKIAQILEDIVIKAVDTSNQLTSNQAKVMAFVGKVVS